jgi:UDP-N-acetylmuramyl pentapeptide phosphotransferase/UDP-N-acetylglucosamine-1-phosphate transferase
MAVAGVPVWWLAMHFVVAIAGTWLARRYALRRSLIDQPGDRRSHRQATPRGGGVGVVCALLLAFGWLASAFPAERLPLLAAGTGTLLVAAIAAGGYLVVGPGGGAGWLAAALMAGALGFLPFNMPKARVFLGDVGSGALGFAIAAVVAWAGVELSWESRGLLLLPLVAFGVDAGLTLASRILHGQRWWEPHVMHAYQRWARRAGHGRVTLAYAGWTLVAVALMAWLMAAGTSARMAVAGAFVLSGACAWRLLRDRYPHMEGAE